MIILNAMMKALKRRLIFLVSSYMQTIINVIFIGNLQFLWINIHGKSRYPGCQRHGPKTTQKVNKRRKNICMYTYTHFYPWCTTFSKSFLWYLHMYNWKIKQICITIGCHNIVEDQHMTNRHTDKPHVV